MSFWNFCQESESVNVLPQASIGCTTGSHSFQSGICRATGVSRVFSFSLREMSVGTMPFGNRNDFISWSESRAQSTPAPAAQYTAGRSSMERPSVRGASGAREAREVGPGW